MLRVCFLCILLTVGIHADEQLVLDILNKIQAQDELLERHEVANAANAATIQMQGEKIQVQDEQIQKQEAVIVAQAAKIQELEGLVETKCTGTRRHDSFVGFHATTDDSKNLQQGQPLVFDVVITNEGGSYNNQNGIFTCLVGGYYLFTHSQFSIDGTAYSLYIDDQLVTTNHGTGNWGWATLAAVVRCPQGSDVSLKCNRSGCNIRQSNDYPRASTFSGVLLFQQD